MEEDPLGAAEVHCWRRWGLVCEVAGGEAGAVAAVTLLRAW